MKTKLCPSCKDDKPVEEFNKNRSNRDGLARTCRKCGNSAQQKRRNSERQALRAKRRQLKGVGPAASKLRNNMKPSKDELELIADAQHHRCLICCKRKKLVKDHCHSKGSFRGLICQSCNVGLGVFQDDQGRLLRAIQYLRDPKSLRVNHGR